MVPVFCLCLRKIKKCIDRLVFRLCLRIRQHFFDKDFLTCLYLFLTNTLFLNAMTVLFSYKY